MLDYEASRPVNGILHR